MGEINFDLYKLGDGNPTYRAGRIAGLKEALEIMETADRETVTYEAALESSFEAIRARISSLESLLPRPQD